MAATCTQTGLTRGEYCSVCNEVLVAQEIVAAKGHTESDAVKENETNSTCTAAGSYDSVVKCSVCNEEISRETITKPLAAHSYKGEVTAPTCTEKGYTTYTCTACSDTYTDSETEATGHSYEAAVTAPTCTEAGYTTHTCSVCGDTYKDTETEATGHSYEAVVTDPTCTEAGYTTHTCSV